MSVSSGLSLTGFTEQAVAPKESGSRQDKLSRVLRTGIGIVDKLFTMLPQQFGV
jgi:hypothetical protein